eukprot:12350069-Karenia_brevis.AAC.1
MQGIAVSKLTKSISQWQTKDPPDEWIKQEKCMRDALKSKAIVAADDKNPGRAWIASGNEMAMTLLKQVLHDKN